MPQTFFPPCDGSGLRIGLGGAPLGNLFRPVADADARALVDAAWADGCRSFDTAPHYGHGLSERRLGDALRGRPRDSFVLSSKVGRLLVPNADAARAQHGYVDILPFDQRWDFSAAGARRSVEDSLQRLGMACLDVAYVHDPDAATHGERAPAVLRQVIEQTLPELRRLKAQGLVRAIGLGTNDVAVVLQVLREADLDVLMLAGRYSLIDHSALAELLPLCAARGVRVALGGVFNSGILATGVKDAKPGAPPVFNYGPASDEWVARTARIEALCEAHGVPLRAAALQFPLAHPAVDVVMLGARSVAEWADAQAMMRWPVPRAFWQSLRDEGLVPAEAPLPQALADAASVVDAHFHAWQPGRGDYGWLTPALGPICRDVAVADWLREAAPHGVRGGVLVQAAPTEAETHWLLERARENAAVLGVVGWVDMLSPDAPARIGQLARQPKLKGLRPMLQDIADPAWILRAEVQPALRAMTDAGLVLDALVKPAHLPHLLTLAARHPALRIVIDHGAKPDIAAGQWQPWADGMARIAQETAAWCKLSGLLTEAGPSPAPGAADRWAAHLLQCFGPARLVWGSDWPVLELAAPYARWWSDAQGVLAPLDARERAQVMGGNARRLYRL